MNDNSQTGTGYQNDACVVWLTGLSGAGKSTIASELDKNLKSEGYNTILLDGDILRTGICKDLGFSAEDRKENIRRVAEICKLFRNSGFIVLAAFIAPFEEDRKMSRELIEKNHFFEIFVKCSIEECIKRDPKGLYKKALAGEIADFTGISSPYEAPLSPELVVDTEIQSIKQSTDSVLNLLIDANIIMKIL